MPFYTADGSQAPLVWDLGLLAEPSQLAIARRRVAETSRQFRLDDARTSDVAPAGSVVSLSVGSSTLTVPAPARPPPLPAASVSTPPGANVPAVGVSLGETPVVTVSPSAPSGGKTAKEAPAPGTARTNGAPAE